MIFDFVLMFGTAMFLVLYLRTGDISFLTLFLIFNPIVLVRLIQNKLTYDEFFSPFFYVYD